MDVSPIRAMAEISALTYIANPAEAPTLRTPEIVRAVQLVNRANLLGESELMFEFDRETRRPVILIVDRETKEVLRQIPPEYVLRIAQDFASQS